MAKIDLPENWESDGDTVFVENRHSETVFVGVFMLIFSGFFLLFAGVNVESIENLRYYPDDVLFILIPGGIGAVVFGIGLKTILHSRYTWRLEINLAEKRFMQKKIIGSKAKVERDRYLGREAVLNIVPNGEDSFTIGFEGPDWDWTLWEFGWGYSRTRAFAESLSDAIGIEIVDERRRGVSEDGETWWEKKVDYDSEPEERMDMRMATRDPGAQINESVVEGRIHLKGNPKMLFQTMFLLAIILTSIIFVPLSYGYEFCLIVPLVGMIVAYLFVTTNRAWTTVAIHEDKLALMRLASTRIDFVTYKEVPKTSISAIRLERIWHEDNDDHHDH